MLFQFGCLSSYDKIFVPSPYFKDMEVILHMNDGKIFQCNLLYRDDDYIFVRYEHSQKSGVFLREDVKSITDLKGQILTNIFSESPRSSEESLHRIAEVQTKFWNTEVTVLTISVLLTIVEVIFVVTARR